MTKQIVSGIDLGGDAAFCLINSQSLEHQLNEMFYYVVKQVGLNLDQCNPDAVTGYLFNLITDITKDFTFTNLSSNLVDHCIRSRLKLMVKVINAAKNGTGVLHTQPNFTIVNVTFNGRNHFKKIRLDDTIKAVTSTVIQHLVAVVNNPNIDLSDSLYGATLLELSGEWPTMNFSARKNAVRWMVSDIMECQHRSHPSLAETTRIVFLNPRNWSKQMKQDNGKKEQVLGGYDFDVRQRDPQMHSAPDLADSASVSTELAILYQNIVGQALEDLDIKLEFLTDSTYKAAIQQAEELFHDHLDTDNEETITHQLGILKERIKALVEHQPLKDVPAEGESLMQRRFGGLPLDLSAGYETSADSRDHGFFYENGTDAAPVKTQRSQETVYDKRNREMLINICQGPSLDSLHHSAAKEFVTAVQAAEDQRRQNENTSHMRYKQLMQQARAIYLDAVRIIDANDLVPENSRLALEANNARIRAMAHRLCGQELDDLLKTIMEREAKKMAELEAVEVAESTAEINEYLKKAIASLENTTSQAELSKVLQMLDGELRNFKK